MTSWLDSIHNVVSKSRYVQIGDEAIARFTETFDPIQIPIETGSWPFRLMTFSSVEDEMQFWFLSDAQAFCFWGYPTKWTIEYQGKKLDGWWALLATHQRAVESGILLLDAKYLKRMTKKQVSKIYDGLPEIPLLEERKHIFTQIGEVLDGQFDGQFIQYLKQAPKDAVSLVTDIAETFAGFDDVAHYKGKEVMFYKKSQLLVEDIGNMRNIQTDIQITGMDSLIGEADYKIPALLRSLGLLHYSDELAEKVDYRIELESGSEMEVEIRANMLEVIQRLLKKLKPRYPDLTASKLDRLLWHMSQDKTLISKSYHLTRTINY